MNIKTESQHRNDLIEICKRIYDHGWVASNDGNISIRLGQNKILCTPTGKSKGYMNTEELVIVDMKGNKIEGKLDPSSEVLMHIQVYKNREDINSVIHVHPVFATGFAVSGLALDKCTLVEMVFTMGAVPVTEYGTPSTSEIAENIQKYLKNHNALLLESHGALAFGEDVFQAFYRMETVEHFAKISFVSEMLGTNKYIDENNVKRILRIRKEKDFDSHYSSCRIEDKVIKVDGKNNEIPIKSGSQGININKQELIEIVTNIVKRVQKEL